MARYGRRQVPRTHHIGPLYLATQTNNEIDGLPGNIVIAAPAGTVFYVTNLAGVVGNVTIFAPEDSSVGLAVMGTPGGITMAAPAGSITLGGSVVGVTANIQFAAPPGFLPFFLAGAPGAIQVGSPPGAIDNSATAAHTFTIPVLPEVQPRFWDSSAPLQKALYKYMRPIDQPVNVFVLSDDTVVTDYSIPIAGGFSSTAVPYPWDPASSPLMGPPEGATGGPWGRPAQGYATVEIQYINQYEEFYLPVWIKYFFQGGCNAYTISQNLYNILLAAGFGQYLT